jgi:uncharacterized membrane protein YqjE
MADALNGHRGVMTDDRAHDDRSLGEILKELTGGMQRLFRAEVELAKLETRDELGHVKQMAIPGLVAGLMAFFAVMLLSFAAVWALAEAMPLWAAFLVVGAVYAIVAGLAAMAARNRAKTVHVVPTETIETLEEDAQWLRARAK